MNTLQNEDGMPVLGWLVSWSTRGFSIERDVLLKALAEAGIDEDFAKEVLPKNAATRATRQTAKGADSFHRKVADESQKAAWIVASTEVAANFDAEFTTDTKVVYDKGQRSILVQGAKKAEIMEAFERNKSTYAGDQFRSIVLRYIKRNCGAVTYLDTGNIYFIPAHYQADLKKIQVLFAALASLGASLSVKEEINTKQVRSVMWSLTVGEVTSQVKKMQEDLDKLDEKSDSQDLKDSTVANRLKKYADLKSKVEMYETALQGKASDLKSDLDKLTTSMKKMLA